MTIENAFGILSTVWQILHRSLNFKLEMSINIVKCLLCLHNFLLSNELEKTPENRKYASVELLKKIRENYESSENEIINIEDDEGNEENEVNDGAKRM